MKHETQKSHQPNKRQSKAAEKILRESPKVEGEGSYSATRDYNKRLDKFIKNKGDAIDSMAKDAARTLDSAEGAELKKAEKEARSHAKH